MELKNLEILGLSNGEIKVYSSILQLGKCTINQIHEKTGFERRAIYDIINKLIEKGLISYMVEKGKRTYQSAPINRLKEEIKKKLDEIKKLQKTIPSIEEIYNSSKPSVKFEVFRGKEGMKTVFEDMLNYKNVYVIGGGFYLIKELPYFWPQYNERRIKAKCMWHNLVIHELRNKIPKSKYLEIKFLPREFSANPIVIIVYGNKVVNLSWGDEVFAFIIESKNMAENYKKYQQYLWNHVADQFELLWKK
ncbi:MAG: TrmB family transcriptional regulator [Candidatus Woesearchaeota archaeon]